MLDSHALRVCAHDRHKLVSWYLMAAYAYYVEDDPILSDGAYDQLAKRFLELYDIIEHPHKHLISEDDLRAGTCLLREYPARVKAAVAQVREK